jgi:hypothetical protein
VHRTPVLLAAALLLACADSGREVVVRVAIPGPDSVESPVPQTLVMALPYDRDSLRDALAAASGAERPRAAEAELDSLFARFREPFTAFVTASSTAERLADSVTAMGTAVDPALRARLEEARTAQASAQARLDEVRAGIGGRVDTLRAEVQLWERNAFQNWSTEVEQLGRGRRAPFADTTGPHGTATLNVPGGAWWIHATAHDPLDPNARWYWNIPLPANADTVDLNTRTGTRRARY